ncbi:MAG: MGDG synthase family glycosyltransferase [Anaerovoracaceae bacterium]
MNIIILTGRFGMGHIKAAEAIREQILEENRNHNVEIIDFMDYMFPSFSKLIYRGFNFLVSSCSGLYNMLNKAAGGNGTVPLKVAFTKKIDKLIEEHRADIIVVAFPVCSQYISAYKKMRRVDIPLYTYITDITAHEEWIAPGTDLYFVGDERTKNTLLSKGVKEEKIIVSGIPVKKRFYEDYTGEKKSRKEILVMGGGLGLLPSSDKLLKKLNEINDIHTTLIAGKNEKLLGEVRRKYENIEAIGYTEQVDLYMKRADLIITKAGGITTFEAVASKTPLYIVRPFLEQEFGNAKYIEEHNIGRVLWDKSADECEDIMKLIENDLLLAEMKSNMTKITDGYEYRPVYGKSKERYRKCS